MLAKVCTYFMYKVRYTNSSTEIPEFPIAPEIALELLMAANFLDCWRFYVVVFFLQNKQSLTLPSLFFLIICFAFEFCFLICDNSHLTSLLKTSSQSLSEKSIIFPEETKYQKNFWMLHVYISQLNTKQ